MKDKISLRLEQAEKALSQMVEFLDLPDSHKGKREALIQSFEYSIELVWKTLKLFLEEQGRVVSSPKPILKEAFQAGLLGTDEALWLQMAQDRNLTVHTYNEKLANEIAGRIKLYYPALARCCALLKEKSGN